VGANDALAEVNSIHIRPEVSVRWKTKGAGGSGYVRLEERPSALRLKEHLGAGALKGHHLASIRRAASRLSHERSHGHSDKPARNERRHETLGGGTKLTHKKRGHERHAIPTAAGLQGREWAVKETVAACVRGQDAVL
jgi:hypothetical protein